VAFHRADHFDDDHATDAAWTSGLAVIDGGNVGSFLEG